MILFDVNVLVYAYREDADRHKEYRRWLKSTLDGQEACAVSELVLSGFLRVCTHPKVFDPPAPLDGALDFTGELRSHANVMVLSPGHRHWEIFQRLCRDSGAKGNLISDAYHAALAVEYGCEWITTDRDFARFQGLKWRHPLDG
ncbi:type II toxin-antitoxin system VapC family toxin [Kiritimatiella glycovorans]|uniref:Ribonuclease VapC n=1 Tax=Kiritimatiella glycovorans TaxID=1307763 RepID=A0A0G3EBT8_9BACT|nr:type II toxin-antitoxin system VapC family toxin [Kiritimatiella glycovorans]AKJ63921.1 putative ribonuclease VapC43 [Kiritimatiella glycovorans]